MTRSGRISLATSRLSAQNLAGVAADGGPRGVDDKGDRGVVARERIQAL